MTKKQKKMLKRIIATSILYAVAVILKHATTLPSEALFAAFLIPYVLISYDVLIK